MKDLKTELNKFMAWMANNSIAIQQDHEKREDFIDEYISKCGNIRVLTLHHPTGHPYWNAGEFTIEMPDGSFYPIEKHHEAFGHGYRIDVKADGIYYVLMFCGTGYGKVEGTHDRFAPIKIISKSEYDIILYSGERLIISDTLKQNLRDELIRI
jgi:hypothetical protein